MMTRGCIALFCQVLLASAIANEIPCASEDSSTCAPSEAGLGDDTSILIQRKVDMREQRIGEEEQSSHGWVVKPPLFEHSMTMTARVKIGSAFQTEGTLAAFGPLVEDPVGSLSDETQIRGVQSNPGTSPFPGVGTIYGIMMYANDAGGGELLTFRFKDKYGKVTTLKPTETFQVDANLGDARTPIDLEADGDAWDMYPPDFENSMTMTAQIKIDGVVQSSGVLAAFSGSQVRGVCYLSCKSPFGSVGAIYMIPLYGNTGNDLKFKFKDGSGTVTELAEEVKFVVNRNIGNAITPETFTQAPPTCVDKSDQEVGDWTVSMWGAHWRVTCATLGDSWQLCHSDLKDKMAEYCAKTCKACTTVAPPTCADKSDQEVGDWTASMWGAQFDYFTCAKLDGWKLCVDPTLKDKMAEYCAKTCKAC